MKKTEHCRNANKVKASLHCFTVVVKNFNPLLSIGFGSKRRWKAIEHWKSIFAAVVRVCVHYIH